MQSSASPSPSSSASSSANSSYTDIFDYAIGVSRATRMSMPPPYSIEDPQADRKEIRVTRSDEQSSSSPSPQTPPTKGPSLLLEVALGHRMACKVTRKKQMQKAERLEKTHDAWLQLGIDTRDIMARGGQLPPYFWNPPRCSPDQYKATLDSQLGL